MHNREVTDTGPDPPTDFEVAENKFSQFLRANRYPAAIRWINAEDLVCDRQGHCWIGQNSRRGLETARQRYSDGLVKNLGILLQAVCASGTETFAVVFIPADKEDAQYHLLGSSLRLACPTQLRRATVVGNSLRWWVLNVLNKEQSKRLREFYEV